ncbi:GMC family oxidoreductase [Donghicola sp. C2-DW-16]|uniref:GMC family oxidoreductase n=1 Tax=Donghicola mangrovi TaxID=2729614 RepID=A0ABX2PE35_9RHOB|nr:GMC family oxidoreductase [Donghicola mangrovi]NVO27714.1 GMC family oxidoreductase [Donghicola mangrovi]
MTTVKPLAEFDAQHGQIDYLIIGAGPAGLTVAAELADTGANIVLLDSAGKTESAETAALDRTQHEGDLKSEAVVDMRRKMHGENTEHWQHEVQEFGVRCRMIGGSTVAWAGKSATFDPIDFAKRDWVPLSGWPIDREGLHPYFERAAEWLNLGPNAYDDSFWEVAKRKPAEPTFSNLRSYFWQFARSRVNPMDVFRMGEEFLQTDRPNVTIVTDATALKILSNDAGTEVTGVLATSLDGTRKELYAGTVVLAASAVENARLLLLSKDAKPAGLGNDHDQVGRYLMDHPGATLGRFPLEDLGPIKKRFGFYGLTHEGRTLMYMPGLSPTDAYQAEHKTLNCVCCFMMERAEDNPIDAIKRILKNESTNKLADVKSIFLNFGIVGAAVGQKVLQSKLVPHKVKSMITSAAILISPNFVVEEFETRGVPHKITGIHIKALTEQEPDPENRIVLSEDVDRFGQPLPKVIWTIGEAPRKSLADLATELSDQLAATGLPRPVLADWITEKRYDEAVIIDMAHTVGTTRMAEDPTLGVVDADCKVHGVNGLYVAGASVFPTSGHANPTLMIASFCMRLADHLKEQRAAERNLIAAQ